MRKLFFILLLLNLVFIHSCDDGDIITVNIEFGETFRACEGVSDLVLYKIKEDPSESLSVLINNFSIDELFENDGETEKSATLFYRTYSDASLPNNLFCSDIAPQVTIIQNESDNVRAIINIILEEDDNDGVLAEFESTNGMNPIGDNDNDGVLNYLDDAPNDNTIGDVNNAIEDGFDTDGDGLPNFIDADDDGDNILTKDENPDPNDDGNYNDAQDTDNDGTPDYLDNDDDGDGIKTRDEENASQDNNPANDITNPDVGADFLNPAVATTVPATAYRQHTILQNYTIIITLRDISFDFLSQDPLDFGVLENSLTSRSRSVTPAFN